MYRCPKCGRASYGVGGRPVCCHCGKLAPSTPAETDVRCVPDLETNNWYWAFTVNGKPVAQGSADSYMEGIAHARQARWDWEDRDR